MEEQSRKDVLIISEEGQRCLQDALRQLHRVVDKIILRQRGGKGSCKDFGEVVRRYQDRLYNVVYRLVGHMEEAQEVVQETFLDAYQSLNNFKQESQLFTWLYRIAINIALSRKRKHRNGEAGMEPSKGSEASRPSHAMERAADERLVQGALNRLSPEHRIVLILKDVEELKFEEIAEILELPIGTVRSRLHRARQELRDKFRE